MDIANVLRVDENVVDLKCLNKAPLNLVLEALSGIPIVRDSVEEFELKLKALREVLDIESGLRVYARASN